MSWLVQVYTLTIFLYMLAHIIVMFVLTLCTFCSLFAPFLLGYIYIWIRDGAHKLFGVSAPLDTIYIELYHELWFMFCYVYFPFSIMLWYVIFLCGVNKHIFDLTWLDLKKHKILWKVALTHGRFWQDANEALLIGRAKHHHQHWFAWCMESPPPPPPPNTMIYAVNQCVSRWNGRDTMDVIFFSYHVRAD